MSSGTDRQSQTYGHAHTTHIHNDMYTHSRNQLYTQQLTIVKWYHYIQHAYICLLHKQVDVVSSIATALLLLIYNTTNLQ